MKSLSISLLLLSFTICFIVIATLVSKPKEYKYRIISNSLYYDCDNYVKDSSDCVHFVYRKDSMTVCGNYIIVKR